MTASLPRITTKLYPDLTSEPLPSTAPLPSLPSPHPPTPVPSQLSGAPRGPHNTNDHGGPDGGRDDTSPISPTLSTWSPLYRPLSPDLPNRDALYIFSNFSSYMRSPDEGSEGVAAEDFRYTIKLLDHARSLAAQPRTNVHILHLKYRFQGQHNTFRSPYSSGDYQRLLNYRDSVGRVRNPVPQPFSVLHDPVVKIDYRENGLFEPLPAQAVFSHIAKMCRPPPRVIVTSYVYSKVIENHLASLSTWALTSSPPIYVFSPLETRLRERRPLHLALHHAIPMSMFAWPAEGIGSPMSSHPHLNTFPSPISPSAAGVSFGVGGGSGTGASARVAAGQGAGASSPEGSCASPSRHKDREQAHRVLPRSSILLTRQRSSGQDSLMTDIDRFYARQHSAPGRAGPGPEGRSYPPDPVASLAITSLSLEEDPSVGGRAGGISDPALRASKQRTTSTSHSSGHPGVDRIPLWYLARSTSAPIGVRLIDFSAINLVGESGRVESSEAQKAVREREEAEMGVKTEVMQEELALLGHPSTVYRSVSVGVPDPAPDSTPKPQPQPPSAYPMVCLSPPDQAPPDLRRLARAAHGSLSSPSWPVPVSRVSGWRKGRREMMEDTLEEMGMGCEEEERQEGSVLGLIEGLALGGAEAGEGGSHEREGVGDGDELLDLLVQ